MTTALLELLRAARKHVIPLWKNSIPNNVLSRVGGQGRKCGPGKVGGRVIVVIGGLGCLHKCSP